MRLVLLLLVAILFGSSANGQQSNDDFVEAEIYVKVKKNYVRRFIKRSTNTNVAFELPSVQSVIQANGNEVESATSPYYKVKDDKLNTLYRIKLSEKSNLRKLIESLKDDPSVEYAEIVQPRKIIATPNDPSYSSQWFLNKVKASEAWDVNPGQATVKVAVVDNAIDTDHIDLAANMLAGRDVADNDNNPNPPNATFDHGTHVSGIVSAVTNNGIGIASAANNKIKIIPVKATSDLSNNRFIDAGFEGVQWAADNGADIISLSWGGGGYSQAEQDVIDYAYNLGILVIAAAGNDDNAIPSYPAAYNHVISVAALDDTDTKSSFSTYGTTVDISAPGRSILSTLPNDTYGSFNGTSMATPLVASCAGYLLSCFPSLSPDSLELILKVTADNIETLNPSYNGQLGAGRVNLLKAISCQNSDLFDPVISATPSAYFCEGDSSLLGISAVGSETFEWFKNGNSFGENSNSFYVTAEGSYVLERTLNDCVIQSDPFQITFNTTFTDPPLVQNYMVDYCETVTLNAIPPLCTNYGPKQYDYSGPVVGFDGLEVSGNLPTVLVDDIGGLIDTVAVSITWQKKDGGNYLSCGTPDGGGTPFNEEVSFQLKSPSGKIINLVLVDTYLRNAPNIGDITTVFSMNSPVILPNSNPQSGSFAPAGDLGILENDVPVGTWTLIAEDNATLDPLCVSGFAMIIKTKEPLNPPQVSWFDQALNGNLIGTTPSIVVNATSVGDSSFFASAICEGMCPSSRLKSELRVKSIPSIFALPVSEVLITNSQLQTVVSAQTMNLSIGGQNLHYVNGLDSNGDPYNFLISNSSPDLSPVTLCGENDYVVFAQGCNGTISWSTGENQLGIYLENIPNDTLITATCNQTWNCAPLVNVPFQIAKDSPSLTISGFTGPATNQTYFGELINSDQIIDGPSLIEYRAPKSILLEAGFEAKASAVFSAQIGDCISP